MNVRLLLLRVIAVAVVACGVAPTPTPTSLLLPTISVANGTTVPVATTINGVQVGTVPPGTTEDPIPATLPARPWIVEARSSSGRVLATLTVSAEDSISANSGVAVREDLACGRLDLWSGPPLLGPMFSPDPSKPCD
jgi:hypothetical protein